MNHELESPYLQVGEYVKFKVGNRLNKAPNVVYIGRGSVYGNPFRMQHESDRQGVIEAYRHYIWKRHLDENDLIWKKAIEQLLTKGLSYDVVYLSCFCSPKACHGDVLINYLAWLSAGSS